MLPVTDMITRIRASTHDQQKTGYTDMDLLGYINDGVRFMRRTILAIAPELLAGTPITGVTSENHVVLDNMITQIISVFCNNKRLHRLSKNGNIDKSGEPYGYFISGFNTVNFYPSPDKPINYSITVISDMQLLTIDSLSPFPNDLDDFVYEYALIRASIGNEYDVSQETSVMGTIISQVENIITNLEKTNGLTTRSYWDCSKPVKRY